MSPHPTVLGTAAVGFTQVLEPRRLRSCHGPEQVVGDPPLAGRPLDVLVRGPRVMSADSWQQPEIEPERIRTAVTPQPRHQRSLDVGELRHRSVGRRVARSGLPRRAVHLAGTGLVRGQVPPGSGRLRREIPVPVRRQGAHRRIRPVGRRRAVALARCQQCRDDCQKQQHDQHSPEPSCPQPRPGFHPDRTELVGSPLGCGFGRRRTSMTCLVLDAVDPEDLRGSSGRSSRAGKVRGASRRPPARSPEAGATACGATRTRMLRTQAGGPDGHRDDAPLPYAPATRRDHQAHHLLGAMIQAWTASRRRLARAAPQTRRPAGSCPHAELSQRCATPADRR